MADDSTTAGSGSDSPYGNLKNKRDPEEMRKQLASRIQSMKQEDPTKATSSAGQGGGSGQ